MVLARLEHGHLQVELNVVGSNEEYIMVSSKLWMAGVVVAAVVLSEPGQTTAQDRSPATRDDAVLSVDGVVREVFQSARQDRVDFIVQIEVKRSEALRTTRTPVRVLVPAPGDLVYVHASGRAENGLGLAQTDGGQPPASGGTARAVPAERSQVRAYLYPKTNGGWIGAGSDWFELTSRDLAEASPTDPAPAAADRIPRSPGLRPDAPPGSTRAAKSALTALGLTGEALDARGKFAFRVSSVEPGGPSQRSGLEPGDVIIGVNDKALTGIDQLDELARQGGRLNLVVLDVNTGKTARVPVELPGAGRVEAPGGLPPLGNKPDSTPLPRDGTLPPSRADARSLGISAEPVTIGQRTGMKVIGVHPDSPAQKAGIEAGDVIVAANGVPITGAEALSAVVHKSGAGLTLTVRDTRTGKDARVEVKLGGDDAGNLAPAPADAAPATTGTKLGAVTELVFHDVDPAAKVTEVEPGSPAARAGIEPGDVIVEANGTPVLHPKTLDDLVRKSGPVLKLIVVDPRTRQKHPVEVKLGPDR
jgi:serine protease Do